MKKGKFFFIGLALLSLATITMPFIASARHITIASNVFSLDTLKGPILVCAGTLADPMLPPCEDLCDFVAQVANIIYFMMAVVIWLVIPALLAVGGIMYMFAGANPGMIQRATKTITSSLIGLAIMLSAWLIVYSFINILKITDVGGFGTSACTITPPPAPPAT